MKTEQFLVALFGDKVYSCGRYLGDSLLKGHTATDKEFIITRALSFEEVYNRLIDHVRPLYVDKVQDTITIALGNERSTICVPSFHINEDIGGPSDSESDTSFLWQDFGKRIFTMDTLYKRLSDEHIVDFLGGQKDIHQRILKAVHSGSFKEDLSSILDAILLASQYAMRIEPKTMCWMIDCANSAKELLDKPELMWTFLCDVLQHDTPSVAFELLKVSNLLPYLLPDLHRCVNLSQGKGNPTSVYQHTMLCLDYNDSTEVEVALALLFHDLGKPKTFRYYKSTGPTFYAHERAADDIIQNAFVSCGIPADYYNTVLLLVHEHETPAKLYNQSDKKLRKFIRRVGEDNIELLQTLCSTNAYASCKALETMNSVDDFFDKVNIILNTSVRDDTPLLAINGHDIMSVLNMCPGPNVQKIKNTLLERIKENPSLNTKKSLMSLLTAGL